MKQPSFKNPDIQAIYESYPDGIREKCLQIRALIFQVAKNNPAIGPIEETLRWGEPSYIPTKTKSGTVVRLHHYKSKPFDFALYFLCNTTLVETFRELYPNTFRFGGNRALEFMVDDQLALKQIEDCIERAFSYYLEA